MCELGVIIFHIDVRRFRLCGALLCALILNGMLFLPFAGASLCLVFFVEALRSGAPTLSRSKSFDVSSTFVADSVFSTPVNSAFCENGTLDTTPVWTLGGGGARALIVNTGIFKGLQALRRGKHVWPQKVLAVSGSAWFSTIFTYAAVAVSNEELLGSFGETTFCHEIDYNKCRNMLTAFFSETPLLVFFDFAMSLSSEKWKDFVYKRFLKKFGLFKGFRNTPRKHAPEMYALVASLYEQTNSWDKKMSIQAHGHRLIVGDGSNNMCLAQSRAALWPSVNESMRDNMSIASSAAGEACGVVESAALSSYPWGLATHRLDFMGLGWKRSGYYLQNTKLPDRIGRTSKAVKRAAYHTMSDSGNVDGTGVPTALAMGHFRIVSVIPGGGALDIQRAMTCDGLLKCYQKYLPLGFLELFFPFEESILAEFGQIRHYNHVFSSDHFRDILLSLLSSIINGLGPVVTSVVTTVPNMQYHIEGGRSVQVTFIVLPDMTPEQAVAPKAWLSEERTKTQLKYARSVALTHVGSWMHETAGTKLVNLINHFLTDKPGVALPDDLLQFWQVQITDFAMSVAEVLRCWLFSEMIAWIVTKHANEFLPSVHISL
eukprot:TRINITY_DN10008_c0_g2_i1.p1 TRINITY_DN10008_c0_g2~~TRINITY_DN10008_c0_g2_i1.p1  ORF type:complete len:601 (+),score=65.53 TRINITY_DN10008_c0_g2_i1:130-1932(+)